MELPQSFTGHNTERLSYESFQEFCFTLQAYGSLKIIETSDCVYPNNYFSAVAEDSVGQFVILQNCFVPIAAFATKTEEGFEFISKPSSENIARIFLSQVRFLSRQEFNENIEAKHMESLSDIERKELRHWLPDTIGGVLFSWYFD